MARKQEAPPFAAPDWVDDEQGADAAPGRFVALTNMIGALLSLALIVGVGLWAYKIVIRDVSGVPVVRAAEGPMRSQPDDPGGMRMLHQGLAVNGVAESGAAADPVDQLILAPAPLNLKPEDAPRPVLHQRASAPVAQDPGAAPDGSGRGQRIGASSQAPETLQLAALVAEVSDSVGRRDASGAKGPVPGDGLARSLRPRPRPAQLVRASATDSAASAAAVREVDPATIPMGTRLAQLGAFESADVARREWDRLAGQFGEYLDRQARVIQKAKSGGRTFYRLRVTGFENLADARQFCSVLLYRKAECIPVIMR